MVRREKESGKFEDTKPLEKNVSFVRSFVNLSSRRLDHYDVLCQYPLSYCVVLFEFVSSNKAVFLFFAFSSEARREKSEKPYDLGEREQYTKHEVNEY